MGCGLASSESELEVFCQSESVSTCEQYCELLNWGYPLRSFLWMYNTEEKIHSECEKKEDQCCGKKR